MNSIVKTIDRPQIISFVQDNLEYEVLMGSQAYGCATPKSDIDIYGFCLPTVKDVWPEKAGIIPGFDKYQKFEQQQIHHRPYKDTTFDANIYNVVKYVRLVADCNPNMIDSLFVPDNCILFLGKYGKVLRDNRHLFLCKKVYHSFTGYLHAQKRKLYAHEDTTGKRKELIEKFGYDVKCAYHMVRLAFECHQILSTGNLILNTPTSTQYYKEIREGKWSIERVLKTCEEFEKLSLNDYQTNNDIPMNIQEGKIHNLLLGILQEFYNK